VNVVAAPALPPHLAVLSASEGAQISASSPDRGHGLLTYFFLKGLRTGRKDLGSLYDYLKPLVEDEAKALNVRQTPGLRPSRQTVAGRFVLRR
jgi:hypothetical protein